MTNKQFLFVVSAIIVCTSSQDLIRGEMDFASKIDKRDADPQGFVKDLCIYSYWPGSNLVVTSDVPSRKAIVTGSGSMVDCHWVQSSTESVLIGYGVEAIRGLPRSLKSVYIPDSVTLFSMYAFSACSSLENLTLPSSLTMLMDRAFEGCSKLKFNEDDDAYYLGSRTNKYFALVKVKDTSVTSFAVNNKTTIIGGAAFASCTSLESITIPDSVTAIGSNAFSGCSSLLSVNIPDSVTTIGALAFDSCSSLREVNIPNSVTSIGGSAFAGCRSLKSIAIPASVTDIGDYAFLDMSSWQCYLESVFIDSNNAVENFKNVFGYVSNVTLGNNVTRIPKGVFSACTSWQTITLPNSVTSVGRNAFPSTLKFNEDDYGYYLGNETNEFHILIKVKDKSVTSIRINDKTSMIASGAFDGCNNLTSITIPDSVTVIGNEAFSGYDFLKTVIIPNSVTSIEDFAFSLCPSLSSVTISKSVVHIGVGIFSGCSNLTSIEVEEGSNTFRSIDGVLFDKRGKILLQFPAGRMGHYSIPNSVTSIDAVAFRGSHLTSITIPDSVTSIGQAAFWQCKSLLNVTIPDSVSSIAEAAFRECTSLRDVVISNSLTSLGLGVFLYCSSLSSVIIPDSVYFIENNAFAYCDSLVHVTIPASVISIGPNAFSDSITSLTLDGNFAATYFASSNTPGSKITHLMIGPNVTFIANGAFSRFNKQIFIEDDNGYYLGNNDNKFLGFIMVKNKSVSSFVINNDTVVIASGAFSGCSNLTNLTIPDSVISIGSYAFEGCDELNFNEYDNGYYLGNETNQFHALVKVKDESVSSFTVNSNTSIIASGIFTGCSSLTSIIIPESVTMVGSHAFWGCSALTDVIMSNAVTSIGDNAFCGCTSLVNVIIPNSVNSIGDYAFFSCLSLENVTMPDSVRSIGSCSFRGCNSLESITIPYSVASIGALAFDGCSSLAHAVLDSNYAVEKFTSVFNSSRIVDVIIGRNVTFIADYAFCNYSSLTSITIPDSVISIGNYAFFNCNSLTSITIPSSVSSIGEHAFDGCNSLSHVCYLGTNDPGCSSCDIFSNCKQLTRISVGEKYTNNSFCGIKTSKDGTCSTKVSSISDISSFSVSSHLVISSAEFSAIPMSLGILISVLGVRMLVL